MADVKVRSYEELYEYANHLRWAEGDMNECYHDLKAHAADFAQQWRDDSAERFMQFLEQKQSVIQELAGEFSRFEEAVRRRGDYISEYVSIGKQYSF